MRATPAIAPIGIHRSRARRVAGIVSAINVTHWYMATKNPAPAPSTNSAFRVSGIITPQRKKAPQRGD